MERRRNILLEKSDAFANRIIKMYQVVSEDRKEYTLSKQVLRSGTSIGANLAESVNAQSTQDYLSKQNIALKEANETAYWLTKLQRAGYISDKEYHSMANDCDELVKMLVSSVKTLKGRLGRL